MPRAHAWADLAEAIEIFRTGTVNLVSPFNCSHDRLGVMADPASYTKDQLVRLDDLGFSVDSDGESFYSWRFGSA
jgi:hypothetical protein